MQNFWDFGMPRGGLWDMPGVEPIDYGQGIQQALAANAAKPPPKPKFFGEGGVGRNIAGYIGDALAQMGGMQPIYAPAMQERRRLEADQADYERKRRDTQADWQAQKEWALKNEPPKTYEIGNNIVSYDPQNGPKVVYEGENPAVAYAKSIGAEPGTPEFVAAIKDFVLKGNGPTALQGDKELAGYRFGNSMALRQAPTYAQTHPKASGGGKGGGGAQYEYRMGPGGTLQKRRVR